jgi:hypothetical protein
VSAPFPAKFSSPCGSCGGWVTEGDMIVSSGATGAGAWEHAECPEVAEFEPLPGTACPRCFCTHRGEC